MNDRNDRMSWPVTIWLALILLASFCALFRHPFAGAALLVLAIACRLGYAALVPSRKLPRDRVRRMRLRLKLGLIPSRGFATSWSIRRRFSARSIIRRDGPQIRPSLTRAQMRSNPHHVSLFMGKAHLNQKIRLPLNRHLVIIAPPRQGKTGLLGAFILRYPGSVLCTSTRTDLYDNTSGVRAMRGPIYTYNPQKIGGLPSSIQTNPVHGCADEQTAIRRAIAFCEAASGQGTDDQGFWEDQARSALAGLLCAADLVKADLRLVYAWATGLPHQAVAVLELFGKLTMAEGLYEFAFSPADKTTSTIRMVLKEALSFCMDPNLASCVLPADGIGFDFAQAIEERATLYLIGESDGKSAPVAGLFAFLAAEWKWAATQLGSRQVGGKLDPPTLLALDEIAAVCPITLPQWLQDSGGKGIQIVSVSHGTAQLEGRWEITGRRTIMDTSSFLILPGVSDPELLKLCSDLCGTVLLRRRGEDRGKLNEHPLMAESMIRRLPDFRALLISDSEYPVIVKLGMSWDAREHRDAVRAGTSLATVQPAQAMQMVSADTTWAALLKGAQRGVPEEARAAVAGLVASMAQNDTRSREELSELTPAGVAQSPILAADYAAVNPSRKPPLRHAYGPVKSAEDDSPGTPVMANDETVIEADGEVTE